MRKKWFGSLLTAGAAVAACVFVSLNTVQADDKPKTEVKTEVKTETTTEGGTTTTTVAIGKPAPDFELTSADGKKVKLSDYKDKIVVLEWFNYECPYCKKAVPAAKESAEKYAKQNVVWLAVDSTNFRKAEDNAKFAKDNGISYPILMDNDGKVGRTYGAKTTPHMYIINKGTLVYMGAHDNQSNKAEAGTPRNYVNESLDAILANKPVPLAETRPYGCSVKYRKE